MALNWALLYNYKHKETHKVKKYYLNVVEQIPGPEGLRDCLAQCGLLQLPMQVHHAFVRIYNQLLRHPGSLRLYIKDIQAMEEKPLHVRSKPNNSPSSLWEDTLFCPSRSRCNPHM